MNRRSFLLGTAVLSMVALAVGTGTAQVAVQKTTGVSASPHNLASVAGGGVAIENMEVCRPCHTPHGVLNGQDHLWNHQSNPAATYSLYNVAHTKTTYKNLYVGIDSASKLCLSCHDGAIAVDNYGGKTSGAKFISAANKIGGSGTLGSDHPIGLKYPGLSDDGKTWTPAPEYNDPTVPLFNADGVGTALGVQVVPLPVGQGIGCASCHQSHDNSLSKFLRTPMTYSFLCLKCHNK